MAACCASCYWRRERRDEHRRGIYCAHDGGTLSEVRLATLEAEPYQYGKAPCPQYLSAAEAILWQPR